MTEPNVSPHFRDALESQRESLNQRFRNRRMLGADIDPKEFSAHVMNRIGPIAEDVYKRLPERTRVTVSELIDVSLDLFACKQLGDESRSSWMCQLWERVLPSAAWLIARDPGRCVGSLSNGLIHIERHNPEAVGKWLESLHRVIPDCEKTDEWLVAGKIAAWTAGMVQYRTEAISLARSIRPSVMRTLLALPESTTDSEVANQIDCLSDNPWHRFPHERTSSGTTIERVGVCCKFRGFGGTLMAPPRAATIDGHLMVTDGSHVWVLQCDRFGWTTQRNELDASTVLDHLKRRKGDHRSPDGPVLKNDGTIVWGSDVRSVPELTKQTSEVFDGRTFAVTIATSFHVFLFSKPHSNANASMKRGG